MKTYSRRDRRSHLAVSDFKTIRDSQSSQSDFPDSQSDSQCMSFFDSPEDPYFFAGDEPEPSNKRTVAAAHLVEDLTINPEKKNRARKRCTSDTTATNKVESCQEQQLIRKSRVLEKGTPKASEEPETNGGLPVKDLQASPDDGLAAPLNTTAPDITMLDAQPAASGRTRSGSLKTKPPAGPSRTQLPDAPPGHSGRVSGKSTSGSAAGDIKNIRRPTGQPFIAPRAASMGLASLPNTEPAAAQTVVEAQDRGEIVKMQDDAMYALDGLQPSCTLGTQRDSAIMLAELLATRRGRLALRADDMTQQILSAAAKVKGQRDPALAIAFSVMLLACSQPDAHPKHMSSTAAAVLMDQLLQVEHGYAATLGSKDPITIRAVRLLREGQLARELPAKYLDSHTTVVLLALSLVTKPSASNLQFADRIKNNYLKFGILDRLAAVLARYSSRCRSAAEDELSPSELQTALWHTSLVLVVIENATFTCPDNEAYMVTLRVTSDDSKPMEQVAFPAFLISQVNALQQLEEPEAAAAARQCVHACLAVLMNLTHQNTSGAQAITQAGGLAVAARLIACCCRLLPESNSLQTAIMANVDLVSVALGMLINLVAINASVRPTLLATTLHDVQFDIVRAGQPHVLQLLCRMMEAMRDCQQHQEQPNPDALTSPSQMPVPGDGVVPVSMPRTPSSLPGMEVTEAALASRELQGKASIIEAYTAILLGFLLQHDAGVQASTAALLGPDALATTAACIENCLQFYLNTGAITEFSRDILVGLVSSLQKDLAPAAMVQ